LRNNIECLKSKGLNNFEFGAERLWNLANEIAMPRRLGLAASASLTPMTKKRSADNQANE